MTFFLTHHFLIFPICFYAFSSLLIISALMVIFSKNPIQSALYLVLAFFASSALWIMAEAEFLGLILILVYVGAVMTLFLFVVMTIPFTNSLLKPKSTGKFICLSIAIIAALIILMTKVMKPFINATNFFPQTTLAVSNTQAIGSILYTQYLFPFEMAGLILLVAIIAAISLSVKYNRQKIISQSSEQIKVKAKSRLTIIKITPETKNQSTEKV